jgi:hypothetical protein
MLCTVVFRLAYLLFDSLILLGPSTLPLSGNNGSSAGQANGVSNELDEQQEAAQQMAGVDACLGYNLEKTGAAANVACLLLPAAALLLVRCGIAQSIEVLFVAVAALLLTTMMCVFACASNR